MKPWVFLSLLWGVWFLASVACPAPADAGGSPGRKADEVVAEIGGDAVTLFEVERFWRLELMLQGKDWRSPATRAEMGPALIRFINRTLLLAEMDRLKAQESGSSDLVALQSALRSHFTDPTDLVAFLRLLAISEQEILVMMQRHEQLLPFLQRRAGIYAAVGDAEVDAELSSRTRGREMAPQEREGLQAAVRTSLESRARDVYLARWLKDLYRRRKVLILAAWAPEPFSRPDGGFAP